MRFFMAVSASLVIGLFVCSTVSQAEMFIFPQQGQSPQQQEMDQFTCYKWAKEKTGFDPNQVAQATVAPAPQRGGILGGAMGGAALGAIGGAIAGNAGEGAAIGAAVGGLGGGMRQRRANEEAQMRQQEAIAQQNQNRQTFDRAYGVCLEAKGYKVG